MANIIKKLRNKYWKPSFAYRIYKTMQFSPQKAYAQWGEDMLLSHFMGATELGQKDGFFIDVGCNHPMEGNNFYNLYKSGWRGINIDMMEWNIRLHDRYRKGDTNLHCGLSDQEGELEVYSFGATNVLNSLDKDFADEWAQKLNQTYDIEKVRITTLDKVIEDHAQGRKIDILNIDVEGHELQVLAGFDIEKHRPTIIMCEIHGHDMEEVIASKAYQIFKQAGYRLVSRCGGTCFFVANSWNCGF